MAFCTHVIQTFFILTWQPSNKRASPVCDLRSDNVSSVGEPWRPFWCPAVHWLHSDKVFGSGANLGYIMFYCNITLDVGSVWLTFSTWLTWLTWLFHWLHCMSGIILFTVSQNVEVKCHFWQLNQLIHLNPMRSFLQCNRNWHNHGD